MPPRQPNMFVFLIGSSKKDQNGFKSARAIASPSTPSPPFDLVHILFAYFRRFPPSSIGSPFDADKISDKKVAKILKAVAVLEGLDPSRVSCKSLRSGSATQLESIPLEDRMRHGGWSSPEGIKPYMRPSRELAIRVSNTLHNVDLASVEDIRQVAMTSATDTNLPWDQMGA